jgi:hypothetical protein
LRRRLPYPIDGGHRSLETSDDGLARAIEIDRKNLAGIARLADNLKQPVVVETDDGIHCARCCFAGLLHQPGPLVDQSQQAGQLEHAGGTEHAILA